MKKGFWGFGDASSDGSSCSGSAVAGGGSSSIADSSSCDASAISSRPGSAADSWGVPTPGDERAALAPASAKAA